MVINKYFTLFIFILYSGCTSNPFWEDNRTKKIKIQGYVNKESIVSDVAVFVFIEDLNVSTYTDTLGSFSLELPNLEMENGIFSGAVKVHYYIHNYKAVYSTLYITNGRLTREQIDFDENGILVEPITLDKLASFELSIDNIWKRSNGDTLKFSLAITSKHHPFSYYSYVNIRLDPRRFVSSGILLKSMQSGSVYYDKNDTDLLQKIDILPNETNILEFEVEPNGFFPFIIDNYISLEQQLVQSGLHEILPYIYIIQEDVPDELFNHIGIQNVSIIGASFLKMPIDLVRGSLLIQ